MGGTHDRLMRDHQTSYAERADELLVERFARGKGAREGIHRILEAGVGTARISKPLAKRGMEMTGIDAPRGMPARARAKGLSRLVLGSAYRRKLPIPREALKRAITNVRTRVGHRTVACHGLRRPPPGGREHGGRAQSADNKGKDPGTVGGGGEFE